LKRASLYKDYTEEDLLDLFRLKEDPDFLGILLQRYTLLLLGVGLKYLKDKEAASDAVQQVFLKALTHFPKQGVQNFKGWLYILMRNYCLRLIRDSKRAEGDDHLEQLPQETEEEMVRENREFQLDLLEQALEELSPEQRQAIELFYLQELSYQQITEKTGFSYGKVKSYIQNGKRKLKFILESKTKQGYGGS
jgi:RNA polymerase sigma factor (sigma-70 family)